MKVDFKGLIIGGLLGALWVFFIGILIGITLVFLRHGEEPNFNGRLERLFLVIGIIIGYSGSGYIVARLSKSYRLYTAITVGIIGTILCLYPTTDGLALKMISVAFCIPMHYIGAKYYIKKANKSLNKDATSVAPIS